VVLSWITATAGFQIIILLPKLSMSIRHIAERNDSG
jgi:hypothetical protein